MVQVESLCLDMNWVLARKSSLLNTIIERTDSQKVNNHVNHDILSFMGSRSLQHVIKITANLSKYHIAGIINMSDNSFHGAQIVL